MVLECAVGEGERVQKKKPGDDLLSQPARSQYHRRGRLNGRVRDGNACFPSAMVTGNYFRNWRIGERTAVNRIDLKPKGLG